MIIFKLLQFILTLVSSPQFSYQCAWHTLTHKCTHFAEELSWGQKSTQDTFVEIQGANDDWVTLVNSMESAVLWGFVPQQCPRHEPVTLTTVWNLERRPRAVPLNIQYCRSLCRAQWWAPPSHSTVQEGREEPGVSIAQWGKALLGAMQAPFLCQMQRALHFWPYLLSSCFTSVSWSPFL